MDNQGTALTAGDDEFQHHQIESNGITLHVVEMGSGPAVLFCHGFPAIWSSWRSQMAAVAAAGFRAIALDMRGYGGSDAPDAAESYMPFYTVGDLIGLLDQLQIPTAVLVGHDFGATVSWNAAMMRPDRFSAIFGISVPFMQPGGVSLLNQLRARGLTDFYMFDQMLPEADAAWADAATTIPGMYYWTSGQAPEDQAWDPFNPARGLRRPAPEPVSVIEPGYLQEAVESFTRTGFRGGLNYYRAIDPFFELANGVYAGAVIQQPSFFLIGTRDGLNRVRQSSEETLRPALPGLRGMVQLEGIGHWPQLEAPDRVNQEIQAFLAGL